MTWPLIRLDRPHLYRVLHRQAYDQIPCRSFSSRSCRSIGHSLPGSWLTGAPMASQTGPRIPSRIYRIGRLSHPPPPKHGGGRCTGGSGGTAPAICAARDGCTESAAAWVGSSIMRGRIDMITPPGPVISSESTLIFPGLIAPLPGNTGSVSPHTCGAALPVSP